MRKGYEEMEDEMRKHYNLKELKVHRLGPDRKEFGSNVVKLDPDVATVFPDADSVNNGLRQLMQLTSENPKMYNR